MALPRIEEMAGAHQLYVDAWLLCERVRLMSADGTFETCRQTLRWFGWQPVEQPSITRPNDSELNESGSVHSDGNPKRVRESGG